MQLNRRFEDPCRNRHIIGVALPISPLYRLVSSECFVAGVDTHTIDSYNQIRVYLSSIIEDYRGSLQVIIADSAGQPDGNFQISYCLFQHLV
jgi:hypothetical protein